MKEINVMIFERNSNIILEECESIEEGLQRIKELKEEGKEFGTTCDYYRLVAEIY